MEFNLRDVIRPDAGRATRAQEEEALSCNRLINIIYYSIIHIVINFNESCNSAASIFTWKNVSVFQCFSLLRCFFGRYTDWCSGAHTCPCPCPLLIRMGIHIFHFANDAEKSRIFAVELYVNGCRVWPSYFQNIYQLIAIWKAHHQSPPPPIAHLPNAATATQT